MNHRDWVFFLTTGFTAIGGVEAKNQGYPDDVPDVRTAEAIGRAVLAAKFGEEEVVKQLPLTVVMGNDGVWIVQGNASRPIATGGGMAVLIDRHSGRIVNVFPYMK